MTLNQDLNEVATFGKNFVTTTETDVQKAEQLFASILAYATIAPLAGGGNATGGTGSLQSFTFPIVDQLQGNFYSTTAQATAFQYNAQGQVVGYGYATETCLAAVYTMIARAQLQADGENSQNVTIDDFWTSSGANWAGNGQWQNPVANQVKFYNANGLIDTATTSLASAASPITDSVQTITQLLTNGNAVLLEGSINEQTIDPATGKEVPKLDGSGNPVTSPHWILATSAGSDQNGNLVITGNDPLHNTPVQLTYDAKTNTLSEAGGSFVATDYVWVQMSQ